MSGPLVSVIIATNRDTPFLGEAVTSLLAQTYERWELVVVDNGVPDPDALTKRLEGVSHDMVCLPPPVTVSLARNAGVAASRGELLVFLDDDDVWSPARLERQVAALDEAPSAPASYCGGWHMDASGRPFEPAWPAAPATAGEMLSGRARMPHICGAMLIRREAFDRIGGFSPELIMMEDFELALRLLGLGSLVCVPDLLVGYRRHDGNATNTGLPNVRMRREALDLILQRHAWAAAARGDGVTAALLRRHRASERRRAVRDAAAATRSRARRGDLVDACLEGVWGLRHGPIAYGAGLVQRRVVGDGQRR